MHHAKQMVGVNGTKNISSAAVLLGTMVKLTVALAHAARVVTVCSVSVSALAAAIVVALRHRVGRLFVDDDAVSAMVATIAPYAACNFVLDGLQAAVGGVLR